MANEFDRENWESKRAAESDQYPLDLPVPDAFLDGIALELQKIGNATSVIITFFGKNESLVKAWAGLGLGMDAKVMFCGLALFRHGYVEIEDMLNHPLFKHDPLVFSSPMIRSFSSTPVINHNGFMLGSLCVLNRRPQLLTDVQRGKINELSLQVMNYLEMKKSNLDAGRSENS